jgi:two-component system nitrate/nitrite response regulator NarL|tara:strand:+ start:15730 stop:16494 length:765 start_codon:yes stop_codon:yes gene_type:complete
LEIKSFGVTASVYSECYFLKRYDNIHKMTDVFIKEPTMNDLTTSILLIDDHPLLRKGLQQLIEFEDELTVIGEAASGKEGLALAIETDPDLIILDLNMQGMDGLETLKTMRANDVTSRIIMLTVSDNDEDVLTAISYGADGYLLKDMDPEEILEKIKQAALGKMVLSEKLTSVLAQAIRKPDVSQKANILNSLTSREFEILKLIAKGLSNKLIARELDISDGTVKVHVKHLLKKLNLRSRVEAAVWMINKQKEA